MVDGLKGSARSNCIKEFKQIVGSIVVLASPFSAASLANLLGISKADVDHRLSWLHSVLNVPSNQYAPIKLFHLSFRDFLIDPDKHANEFWVDKRNANEELTSRCLDLMSNIQTEKICSREEPGTLQENINKEVIDRCLPPELQYTCLYWVQHLQGSGSKLVDNDKVHQFLQKHLLHWLEALGWMKKVFNGIHAIALLESLTAVSSLQRWPKSS